MSRKKNRWAAAVKRAEKVRDSNIARIEAGETFRGHKTISRKSPSHDKG
jgi:hypothetical protein